MAETITIPGTNKKIPRWMLIAGGVGIFVVVLILSKRGRQQPEEEGAYYKDYASEAASLAPATASSVETSKLPPDGLTAPLPAYVESYAAPFAERYAYPEESGIFAAPFIDPGAYRLPEVPVDEMSGVRSLIKMATEAEAEARSKPVQSQVKNPAVARILLTVMKSTKEKAKAQPGPKEAPATAKRKERPAGAPTKPAQPASTTRPGAAPVPKKAPSRPTPRRR